MVVALVIAGALTAVNVAIQYKIHEERARSTAECVQLQTEVKSLSARLTRVAQGVEGEVTCTT